MKVFTTLVAALAMALSAPAALAQDYPTGPIRMIVGYSAGGPTDVIARVIAQHMTTSLGQSVVVENKTGAAALIATRDVVRAAPDGYTLLFTSLSLNVNPLLLGADAGYDPIKDLAPISLAATLPLVAVTRYDSPIMSIKELVAKAKAKPEAVSYGSSGNGGSAHLAAAMMGIMADVKMLHVPFRGNAPALQAVLASNVDFMFYPSIGISGHVADKKLKVLAVGTAKPLPDFPGVPTMAESGFPGFELTAPWVGLLAPANTPSAAIDKLNKAFNDALKDPKIRQRLHELGAVIVGDSPTEFHDYLVEDRKRWAHVIEAAGIQKK